MTSVGVADDRFYFEHHFPIKGHQEVHDPMGAGVLRAKVELIDPLVDRCIVYGFWVQHRMSSISVVNLVLPKFFNNGK
jgi:hypothetical protein